MSRARRRLSFCVPFLLEGNMDVKRLTEYAKAAG